jgi:hypothetical protein
MFYLNPITNIKFNFSSQTIFDTFQVRLGFTNELYLIKYNSFIIRQVRPIKKIIYVMNSSLENSKFMTITKVEASTLLGLMTQSSGYYSQGNLNGSYIDGARGELA